MAARIYPPLVWYDPQFYPDSPEGYCYLIKLDTPYCQGLRCVRVGGHYQRIDGKRRLVGGHLECRPQYVLVYVGWSPDPWKRYDQHLAGRGARLLAYLARIGWPMRLFAVTPGGRDLEAKLKARHNNTLLYHFG